MRRLLPKLFLLAALVPSPAVSQLAVSVGAEYFWWKEDTTPSVTETGPLYAFGIEYFTRGEEGPVLGYRGKFWLGRVDYDGALLFSGTLIESTTHYTGFGNELQLRHRVPAERGQVTDLVLGLGYESWERKLSAVQREDYQVLYARLGIEGSSRNSDSWSFAAGAKYPFWTREDAHLDNIGFDANPKLKPEGAVSAYAEVGYHFESGLRLVGYYDGYRFRESNVVQVNEVYSGTPVFLLQPESTLSIVGLKLEYRLR